MENTEKQINETPSQAAPASEPTESKSFGPIIGILIIVALLAFGGLYFWGSSMQGSNSGTLPAYDYNASLENTAPAIENLEMTDEEFSALIGDGSVVPAASDTADTTLDNALDDLSDLDALDAELEALELEL